MEGHVQPRRLRMVQKPPFLLHSAAIGIKYKTINSCISISIYFILKFSVETQDVNDHQLRSQIQPTVATGELIEQKGDPIKERGTFLRILLVIGVCLYLFSFSQIADTQSVTAAY